MSQRPQDHEDCVRERGVAERERTPGFLSLQGAANWSGTSARTVRRWVRQGLFVHRSGPRCKLLIKSSDIELFLTRRQAGQVDLDAVVNEVARELTQGKQRKSTVAAGR